MRWDYRVMALDCADGVCFAVHKMYYDQRGSEKMYNAEPTALKAESVTEAASLMRLLKVASQKPILWTGDRFPEVYVFSDLDS